MGVTISGNYKKSISLDVPYNSLIIIRKAVAKAWDKVFGAHYATLSYCSDYEKFNDTANKIINSERLKGKTEKDTDILDFLFAPDVEGKISYKTCKKIYDLIKDNSLNCCLRYAVYSHNDWGDFKQLLKECYSHRANLVWY